MTLAITAAPLNSERRDMSVSGTRAVVSSQQLMRASKCHRKVRCGRQESLGMMLQTYRCSLQRSSSERSRSDRVLAGIIKRCCADDMPGSKLMSNA
jgi:hypothetical protein